MSTITLPNIRVSSDLTVGVVLKDGGVAIDWSTLSNIKAYLYADAQRAMAGRCSVSVDEDDSTRLVCSYRANKPQYIGVNRIVITCTYRGETKTFDKPALNFVRWTDDQAGQQITIDDPDVDVEIEVEDVSSSILEQAIAAALQAAADAEHAAHLIPNQVLLDCEQATAGANAAAEAANAAGITSVNVSVEDNEPGTPSAECTLVNKVLSIIFHYLKGETGDAAGFGAITATVDDVVGDPSVTVTASGPDTAKVLAFAFHGLRGIQGVPGVANAKYKEVDTLPTASAATMDFIYLTPSGTSGIYNMSYTEQDGSTFTWRDLGTTAIQLSDYATKAELSQLELKVDDNFGALGLISLSQGNNSSGTSDKSVRTPVVPVKNGRFAVIVVSRPNAAGCRYSYGYALTSSKNDIGIDENYNLWSGGIYKLDVVSATSAVIVDLASYPSAVGISFTIAEYNGTTAQTLSVADFSGYAVRVLCDDSVENLAKQLVSIYGVNEREELYNAPSNVAVEYELGYVNVSGNAFNYSNNEKFVRTKKGYYVHLFPGDVIKLTDYTNANGNVYWRRLDGTYGNEGLGADYVVKEEGDYVLNVKNTTQTPQVSAEDLGSRIRIVRNHSIKQMLFALRKENGDAFVSNGSNGNPGNASLVHTEVLPTNGARYAIIKVTRPNATGCHYAFGYALTGNATDFGTMKAFASWAGGIIKQDVSPSTLQNIIDLSAYPTAVGISVTIAEYNASNVGQTLRLTDFVGYSVSIVCDKAQEEFIEKMVSEYDATGNIVLKRNKERQIALEAMCRYRRVSSPIKDIQLCICADSHADTIAVNNAVLATNGFDTIDALVHAGDICGGIYKESEIADFQNSLSRLTKPAYIVIGNHDVGNAYYVGYCCNHEQAYAAYIKPMVDAGWLSSGEYQANKPYWHHDDATYKVRLIGLYEYDDNLDFNETYWRAIPYNSALSNIALNTAYALGAQVNVPGYTDYSFEAVQAVTTPSSYYTTPEKLPSYKVRRGDRVIRQTQAQWFLDTLLATPANYGVVVILHNPFANDAVASMQAKFNQLSGSATTGGTYSQNDMATDLIGGALSAFAAGSNYSENVAMKGDAAYLNTEGGGTYAYSVSKNFSAKNTGVKVFGLIGGHSHRDIIWKKGDLVQITPLCATTNISNATGADIRRQDTDGLTKDSLTVISFASGRIGLVKIGVNVTENGTPRDYELIQTV